MNKFNSGTCCLKPAKVFQSTLMGMYGFITHKRRDGNTLRLVDNAIQILYEGKVCVVQDHHELGKHRQANVHLFNSILRRLASEHNLDQLIDEERIIIDRNKLHIELFPRDRRYDAYIGEINRQLDVAIEQVKRIPSLLERSEMTYIEWLKEAKRFK